MEQVSGRAEGRVKFISKSEKNNSFNLVGDESTERVWYVVANAKVEDLISRGDEIEFEFGIDGADRLVDPEKLKVISKSKNSEDWSQNIVAYGDLLKKAHETGLQSISATVTQVDMEKGWAIAEAEVVMRVKVESYDQGKKTEDFTFKTFKETGDATQSNTGDTIKKHFVRMACTRAKARALRDALNISDVADVELSEEDRKK